MKNRILLTCAFVAISTAAIAQATTTGITTRNAENGGFTIKRGDEVNVKGCNGGSGSSGCKDAKAKDGDVAKKICEMADELNLPGSAPIRLATPCGENPEGPITVNDCCQTTTGPNGGRTPMAPGPNKCILTPEELEALKKAKKCPEPDAKAAMLDAFDAGMYGVLGM